MADSREKRLQKIKHKLLFANKEAAGEDLLSSLLADPVPKRPSSAIRADGNAARREGNAPADAIGARFYNEAQFRQQRQRNVQATKEALQLAQTGRPKMARRSLEILAHRVSRKIATVILEVDPGLSKRLSFSQVGRALTALELFNLLQYKADLSVGGTRSDARTNDLLAQDAVLHQLIFGLAHSLDQVEPFTENQPNGNLSETSKFVSADNLFSLLNTLLLPTLSHTQKVQAFSAKIAGSGDLPPTESQRQGKAMNYKSVVASVDKALLVLAQNERQRPLLKNLGNLNEREAQRLEARKAELSFKPRINQTSINLDKKRTEHVLSKQQARPETSSGQVQRTPGKSPDRLELMRIKEEQRNQRIEAFRNQKAEQENRQCTFKPRIRSQHQSRSRSQPRRAEPPLNGFKSKREVLEEERLLKEQLKLQEELDQCTFTPKLSTFKSEIFQDRTATPKNYEKTVARLKTGYQERLSRQRALEHVPSGETYDFWRAQPFSPPLCADGYIVRSSEPFMHLRLKVPSERMATMALRIDDNPALKARDFAVTFQLPVDMEKHLADVISNYIDEEMRKRLAEQSGKIKR